MGEDGGEQNYPYAGLSDADQVWVDAEVKRLSDANRAAAEARRSQASSTPSRFGPGPGSSGHDGARSGGIGFRYEFRCSRCGHEWTGSSAFEKCSACAARLERERSERATESRTRASSSRNTYASDGFTSSSGSRSRLGSVSSSGGGRSRAYNQGYQIGWWTGRITAIILGIAGIVWFFQKVSG